MTELIAIYDDTGRKSEVIADIIGERGFGDVVVRKRHLEEYYREPLREAYPDMQWKKVRSVFEYANLEKELEAYGMEDRKVLHCFSNYLISDGEKAGLSFAKLEYIDEPYGMLSEKRAVAAMFPTVPSYLAFLKGIMAGQHAWDLARNLPRTFEADGFVDISVVANFIQCVTGNFDSRYFNSLRGDGYTVVKRSANKKKIRAEYEFYYLLPDDMKYWFVQPFDYREEDNFASYRMERLHMTDLAVKWVHGSMPEAEFESLLDKYFYFFAARHTKECSTGKCRGIAEQLYVKKVYERVEELKRCPGFSRIRAVLEAGGDSVDDLVEEYIALKDEAEKRGEAPKRLVIGHGDPCFANALYNRTTETLKFIDPKGAVSEEELWTDAYYDVAKLSHSVCGRYDFFNNALYDIQVNGDFGYDMVIPFDNGKYIKIFLDKARENGFDPVRVRVYEASLFLSMLPLHMDNPHKVLGFILNVKNILREVRDAL